MAFSIHKSTLTDEQFEIIKAHLTFTPEVPQNAFSKNPAAYRYSNVEPKEPVEFYTIDDDGMIYLPFLFAGALLSICPNMDINYPTTSFNFKGTLKENQISVESDSWKQLQEKGTSTLALYPGFGKTILGAKLCSRAQLMTVILVHREVLAYQWKKTFEDFTDATVWVVGEKNPPSSCQIIICMDTRWHILPKMFRDAIGFLIIDEAHAFCTPTHVHCLLAFRPKYILIETATLERDDNMEKMIYAIAGNHAIYRESTNPFSVLKINTGTTPARKKSRNGRVNWTSLVNDTLMDPRRIKIIVDLVISHPDYNVLILTSLVDHALVLHKLLVGNGINADYMCGKRKNYQDCQVLVGTTSKIGTGFDQATACPNYSGKRFNLLILACSIKKYAMLVQNVGRVFRADYPTIMHMVDNDDIYKSHWYKSRKWYLARGGTIMEYTIPEDGDVSIVSNQAGKLTRQIKKSTGASDVSTSCVDVSTATCSMASCSSNAPTSSNNLANTQSKTQTTKKRVTATKTPRSTAIKTPRSTVTKKSSVSVGGSSDVSYGISSTAISDNNANIAVSSWLQAKSQQILAKQK